MTRYAGVRPGQLATDFEMAPYPGVRPEGSWVVDRDARLFPVLPDPAQRSGWSVLDADGAGQCLDDWLDVRSAEPMSERLPVLSYGSNANPQKFVRNGVSLPGVSLAADVEDLAAVWCHDARHVERVPATLTRWPGSRERHAISYVTPVDLAPLDLVEGRATDWYRLIRLTEGRVVREDGVVLDHVHSYVGGRQGRLPLVDGAGRVIRLSDMEHADARAAGQDEDYGSGEVPDLGPVVRDTPSPLPCGR